MKYLILLLISIGNPARSEESERVIQKNTKLVLIDGTTLRFYDLRLQSLYIDPNPI